MERFNNIIKSTQWLQSKQKSWESSLLISEIFKQSQRLNLGFSYLDFERKFAIPQTTLYTFSSINRQHEQIFGGMSAMTKALKIQSPTLAQINNLKFALSGISGQIVALAVHQRNWTIIDDFEKVTEQVIEFSESLVEDVTEEQKIQFQILLSSIVVFVNKHKKKVYILFVFLKFY